MSVYLLLALSDGARLASLQRLLERLFPRQFVLYDYPPILGLALPSEKELNVLMASWAPFQNDVEGSVEALVVPFLDPRFLPVLASLKRGRIAYLAEETLGEMKFYLPFLDLLKGVNPELLLTAKVYIETLGSPYLTAERLYLHHNTVSYRVARFAYKTKIDLASEANRLFALSLIRAYEFANGPLD